MLEQLEGGALSMPTHLQRCWADSQPRCSFLKPKTKLRLKLMQLQFLARLTASARPSPCYCESRAILSATPNMRKRDRIRKLLLNANRDVERAVQAYVHKTTPGDNRLVGKKWGKMGGERDTTWQTACFTYNTGAAGKALYFCIIP